MTENHYYDETKIIQIIPAIDGYEFEDKVEYIEAAKVICWALVEIQRMQTMEFPMKDKPIGEVTQMIVPVSLDEDFGIIAPETNYGRIIFNRDSLFRNLTRKEVEG